MHTLEKKLPSIKVIYLKVSVKFREKTRIILTSKYKWNIFSVIIKKNQDKPL